MLGESRIEVLPEIKIKYPDTATITISAITDTKIAIQCMRKGAYNYLIRPFNLGEGALGA